MVINCYFTGFSKPYKEVKNDLQLNVYQTTPFINKCFQYERSQESVIFQNSKLNLVGTFLRPNRRQRTQAKFQNRYGQSQKQD